MVMVIQGICHFIPMLKTFKSFPMSHWVSIFFLSAHYMPGTVLGARVNKTERTELCGSISGKIPSVRIWGVCYFAIAS